ncbi:hypothetical protein ACM3CZ_14575 [Edwardsiella ictaluri]
MKPIQLCTVAGKAYQPASMELVLVLNGVGRGFITITPEEATTGLAGAMVQIDLGEGTEAWRYFTGYVERDQPAENGARRLFVREAAGLLDFELPCSHQHPTLKTVLDTLSQQSGLTIYAPTDESYSTTRIPHLTHAGSGTQLLAQLGRCFAIPDYVWHPMPDGSVYVGSAKQSRFASLALPELPPQYLISQSAGNSATLMPIPTLRPGVNLPNGRITDVAVKDSAMTLTWARLDASGKPLSKSPTRRLIEGEFPELASGALRTRLARVVSPTESASLGDVADPFRPKYAVDLQLLDEQGNDLPDTPVYAAVPLPVPMAGPEAGLLAYPPEGTLVEVAFVEGRPDKPMVRQLIPQGHSLPDIKPGEQLQQQRAEVFQRVGQDGSWHRETDQVIRAGLGAARHHQRQREQNDNHARNPGAGQRHNHRTRYRQTTGRPCHPDSGRRLQHRRRQPAAGESQGATGGAGARRADHQRPTHGNRHRQCRTHHRRQPHRDHYRPAQHRGSPDGHHDRSCVYGQR